MEDTGGIYWLTFLLAAAAIHGAWLAGLLFLKSRRQAGPRLLALAFILLSLYLLNYLLFLTGYIRDFPHLLGVFYPPLFLLGPAYYFFVRNSVQASFRFRRAQLWHLLPALLVLGRTARLYLAPAAYKLRVIEWVMNPADHFTWATLLLGNDFLYHMMAYATAAWWLARRAEGRQEDAHNRREARWLKQLSLAFWLLLALDLGLKIGCFALKIPAFTLEYLMASALALALHLAGYRIIGRLGGLPFLKPAGAAEHSNGQGNYRTSPLTPEQLKAHQAALLALMEAEAPYLDPGLKVSALAGRLDIPSAYLSQVLNEGLGASFYDFVNAYRVEAAKERLKDDKYRHYSILAIALECGFASKTAFNRAFKKQTGKTPSEFVHSA